MPRNLADTYLQQTTIQSVVNEVALVVKGVSGQTLNLQQWQNSAGTVVASIDRFGTIYMNGSASYLQSSDANSYLFYTPGTTGGTNSEMVADHAGSIPLAVKGAASQTADLQQWQSAAGTVLASVESNGGISAQEIMIDGWMVITGNRVVIATKVVNAWDATTGFTMYAGGTTPGVLLNGSAAGSVPLVVKGFASQTADLQQWQNSAGTMVAAVRADGGITSGGGIILSTASTNGECGISWAPTGSDSEWLQYQSGSGPLYLRDLVNARMHAIYQRGTVGNALTTFTDRIVVKAGAAQSADLQQWQDSAGAVLTSIKSYGAINLQPSDTWLGYASGSNYLRSGTTTSHPIICQGKPAQTGDLQQWRLSDDSVLAYVNAGGDIANPTHAVYSTYLRACPTAEFEDSYSILVKHGAAAKPAVVVRGAASQTADLQQWQTSAGTVMGYVNPAGALHVKRLGVGATPPTTDNIGFIPTLYINDLWGYQDGFIGIGTTRVSAQHVTIAVHSTASNTGLVVQGMAGQTGDLQQWKNSDGAVLTSITPSGSIGAAAGKVGFYGTAPIVKQTGVAVTAAAIHAALVNLGLIAA